MMALSQPQACQSEKLDLSSAAGTTPEVSGEVQQRPLISSTASSVSVSSVSPVRRSGVMPQRQTAMLALPDSALVACFKLLPFAERRALALVCRRFREVADSCSCALWEQVQLSFPSDFQRTVSMAHLYAWFVRREGNVRTLHVDICTREAWAPVLAVLGVVGRGLEHLRVAGEADECQVPGCMAPWLELVPNLLSLELDDVVDHSISDAHFPTGASLPAACMLVSVKLSSVCEMG